MKKYILLILLLSLLPSDSHSQWYKQTIPVNKPITGIEFKDTLRGWAVTTSAPQFDTAYVLHTTNGGANWFVQFQGLYEFDAFDMVNDTVGYIIGGKIAGQPLLLKTTNGGINWIDMNIPVGIVFDDVYFPSEDTGYVCSSNSFSPGLWFTSNGGVSWQSRLSGISGSLVRRVFFLNNNTGWCGSNQTLYETTNAGLNWNASGDFSEFVYGISFLNENIGGVGLSGGKVGITTNGGQNWNIQMPRFNLEGTIHDILFINNSIVFAGTRYLEIYKTTNGGNNWGYQIDSSASMKIHFTDSSHGWTGDFGVAHTTNGGGPITYTGIISNTTEIPEGYALHQNYPNPFNSQTNIRFEITKQASVEITIYDILGKEVSMWKSGSYLQTGTHEINFNADRLTSGTYFYKMTVEEKSGSVTYTKTKKMVLIK